VMINAFSRHVELEVLPSKRADGVASALLKYVARYGVPGHLRTDGGGEFTAGIINDLLMMFGTTRQLVLPYLSRANGVVERANKEVMRHLRPLILNRKEPVLWDRYLPMVQRTMNATINSATGLAPSQILFGLGFDLNRELLKNTLSTPASSDWVADTEATRDEVLRVSAAASKAAVARRPSDPPSTFESGEYVLMNYPKGSKPKGKLGPAWRGPYEILRHQHTNCYDVRHCASGKETRVSDSRLIVYDDSATPDVRAIAAVDLSEWVVAHIVEHRFNPPLRNGARLTTAVARSKLEFLVRWDGFGADEDSWIPYRGNTELAAITPYCDEHRELGL
jgi:hypothetical protein